jgi:hypothetical protein
MEVMEHLPLLLELEYPFLLLAAVVVAVLMAETVNLVVQVAEVMTITQL